jgi:hypothetical protein
MVILPQAIINSERVISALKLDEILMGGIDFNGAATARPGITRASQNGIIQKP